MLEELLTDNPQVSANEHVMARNMAETLHRHYPGHLWAVNVQGSVANVLNLSLSGRWGFTLHIPSQYSASDFDRQVMRAGGEILERYRLTRGRMRPDDIESLPVDAAGNIMH